MKPTYYLERGNGQWEGRWYCKDEDRTYRKVWESPGQCEAWCRENDFHFVLVHDGLATIRFEKVF